MFLLSAGNSSVKNLMIRISVCFPCHRCILAGELVWTESLFYLMQNVLNHNVHLSQGTVDKLVQEVCKFATRFPKSLKLGNLCLCLANKCAPLKTAQTNVDANY